MTESWRPGRAWRRSRYYKIQIFDEQSKVWRDERRVYDEVEEAQAYIREKLAGVTARIMVVEGKTRYPLE